MYNLSNEKLKQITGGGLSFGAWAAIGAGIVFVIGVIDGYVRPYKCR